MRIALIARGDREAERATAALARRGVSVARVRDDEALPPGCEMVVAAGGDGTAGPAALVAADAGLPLAVLPLGTANDFARALGIPDAFEDACDLVPARPRVEPVDLGLIDGRPFLNAVSAGLPVAAARRADDLKPRIGPAAYVAGGLMAGVRDDPVRGRVLLDGAEWFRGPAWHLLVANTGAHGAVLDVDEADPSDGLLDVVVLPAGPRRRLVPHALGLLRERPVLREGARHRRAARVALELPAEAALDVDGDLVTPWRAEIEVRPGAVRVVRPPRLPTRAAS